MLAEVLGGASPAATPANCGCCAVNERARAEAILAMGVTVHGLYRLFDARGAGWRGCATPD